MSNPLAKPRKLCERRNWAWTTAVVILKPVLLAFTRPEWIDGDKIPAKGGCVLAANHVSHLDPLTYAHLIHDHGRLPRFLAKQVLFGLFFVGSILRATGQIPVARQTSSAAHAFEAAVAAVESGRAVFFYPEGTLTRDPGLWPMVGKTGAARVALESGAPLIPMAQWGQQELLYPYAKKPALLPPKTIRTKVGDPVDLDDLREKPLTNEVLHEATDRLMAAITTLLEDLREGTAPVKRYNPREHGVALTGNPNLDRNGRRRKKES